MLLYAAGMLAARAAGSHCTCELAAGCRLLRVLLASIPLLLLLLLLVLVLLLLA
jgi:hypothetical protein